MVPFPVTVSFPVHWAEMDAMGHVNHARYFTWFESARIALFARIGVAADKPRDVGPILAMASCDFIRPVVYPATVVVGSRILKVGRTSITMEYAAWLVGRARSAPAPVARRSPCWSITGRCKGRGAARGPRGHRRPRPGYAALTRVTDTQRPPDSAFTGARAAVDDELVVDAAGPGDTRDRGDGAPPVGFRADAAAQRHAAVEDLDRDGRVDRRGSSRSRLGPRRARRRRSRRPPGPRGCPRGYRPRRAGCARPRRPPAPRRRRAPRR